jgi:hypothetical protein
MKDIEILLPDFEIEELVNKQVIVNDPCNIVTGNDIEIIPSNASLNRVRHWLTTVNCATISAWRKGRSRETNDTLNRELQKQLRGFEYGVIKLKGFYQEVGEEAGFENSYLTFDLHTDPDFYNNIRYLSESYDQDSFLYKAASDDIAYLIGTNEEFIRKNGERLEVGRLKFGNMDAQTYSQVGSGRFSFEQAE